MVVRRHRQRAQRPADRGADRAQRHRLRRRRRERVPQPGGRPHRGHQHARRRRLARHVAVRTSCPASIRSSRTAGCCFLNPAAFATPQPGHVRQPRAQLDPRTELLAGRRGRRQAHRPGARDRTASCAWRSSTSSTTTNFAGIGGDAAERAADATPDRSEQGAARPAVHGGRRRHVRPGDVNRRHDGRPRHEPPDPAGVPIQFLRVRRKLAL